MDRLAWEPDEGLEPMEEKFRRMLQACYTASNADFGRFDACVAHKKQVFGQFITLHNFHDLFVQRCFSQERSRQSCIEEGMTLLQATYEHIHEELRQPYGFEGVDILEGADEDEQPA